MIFFGEFHLQILFFFQVHADHLLFKTGDEAAGADFQGLIFGSAAGESNAVHGAGIIQVDDIAVFDGTIGNISHGGGLFHILLDAGVDFFIGYLVHILDGLQALIFAQLHIGLYKYLDGELQILANADLFHFVHFGAIHNLDIMFLHAGFIFAGEENIKSIIIEYGFAIHAFDDLAGGLALAEAGHIHLAAHLQIGLLNSFVKFFGSDFKGDLHLIARDFFYRVTHKEHPPLSPLRRPCALAKHKALPYMITQPF